MKKRLKVTKKTVASDLVVGDQFYISGTLFVVTGIEIPENDSWIALDVLAVDDPDTVIWLTVQNTFIFITMIHK